ncbi:TorF family putative porin [Rheinheimera sp.]|uniref:TorF family putative porin n=1 Tax=Rheinheimera sp. TaxID=1869214 RepID=UPI00307F24D3
MKQQAITVAAACLLCSVSAAAELTSTFTLATNYLFNGVTLTQDDPAVQPSLDWNSGQGWYGGLWASNVSFDPRADIEFDGTLGYYLDLGANWALDLGIAQYSYHGSSTASAFNYPEAYIKLSYANTKLSYWYANDYFGAGGGHYILMLTQVFQLTDGITLTVSADRSTSTDTTKFLRDNDGTYHHWRSALSGQWQGLSWVLAYDNTDLELPDLGEPTWSFGLAKTISWF